MVKSGLAWRKASSLVMVDNDPRCTRRHRKDHFLKIRRDIWDTSTQPLSKKGDEQSHIWNAALVIFFPFVIVSLISLSMLYQIDGNYFMLLYSMLILGACRAMVYFKKIGFYPLASKCLAPLLVLNLIVTAISSWAWTAGFSEIHLLNKGRVNHRAQEQARMEEKGNTLIWQEVSQDPYRNSCSLITLDSKVIGSTQSRPSIASLPTPDGSIKIRSG